MQVGVFYSSFQSLVQSELQLLRSQVRKQEEEIAKLKHCLRLVYLDGCKRIRSHLQSEAERFVTNAVSGNVVLKEIHRHL